ncbi:MAG: sigma-70 family RNA polymerase sigma factor [Bacteroidetes bacterium]|nr:sigma-70 family RNA polymerase sigma factor [Bacteroidota bacterium]
MLKQLNDQDLVASYQHGNQQALDILLSRHRAKLISTIAHIVKDRDLTEDLYQETMIKAVRLLSEGRYSEKGKYLPWVLRMARNLAIDYFRKDKRYQQQVQPVPLHALAHHIPSDNRPDWVLMQQEDRLRVRKLIQQLPPRQREVLVLRYYNDLSFKEIAEMTDVSINTALGRMRYALINLRKLAEQQQVA